jgi:hypothetical protein
VSSSFAPIVSSIVACFLVALRPRFGDGSVSGLRLLPATALSLFAGLELFAVLRADERVPAIVMIWSQFGSIGTMEGNDLRV